MRFSEDLGGRVATVLGDGPGDQAAAEAVYGLIDLAAGVCLRPAEVPPPEPSSAAGLGGWIA